MVDKTMEMGMNCSHCGANDEFASDVLERITQPQPSGPWYLLEVWTCSTCGWRNVYKKTEQATE